jgi:hypothetical protein
MASRRYYTQDDQNFSSSLRGPSGLPRSVRPQRSMADVSTRSSATRRNWAIDSPGKPSTPNRQGYSRESGTSSTPYRNSKSSVSSASGSSTFSREQADSSTSIEELSSKSNQQKWSLTQRRQLPSRLTAHPDATPNDGNSTQLGQSRGLRDSLDTAENKGAGTMEGYGTSVWNRISSAANTLTINVGKAWSAGLFTDDGEGVYGFYSSYRYLVMCVLCGYLVTPPGGETRLTRALKSYHLNKARTTSDLPVWLFTEEERRVSRSSFTSRENDRMDEQEMRTPRRKGLRTIYADLAETSTNDNTPEFLSERTGFRNRLDQSIRTDGTATGSYRSKATTRLQSMRDARRPIFRGSQASTGHTGNFDDNAESLVMRKEGIPATRRDGLPKAPKQHLY